ncbi:MAG: amidophosphoribosyltransferase [Bacteroidaceae bacterium]|nr:amidophosphoribosyltransferase [Bacteroidaceae bacterium]
MEQLKHECGVVLIRLLKPLDFYQQKYSTWMFGLNKLYLMMEKQRNRGQEAAGLAVLKMRAAPGREFFFRERAQGTGAIAEIFRAVSQQIRASQEHERTDATKAEVDVAFAGEIYMGHLRYSTTGRSGLSYVHPFMRRSNFRSRSLCICGNFNLTNVDEIFQSVTESGQHPREYADTYLLLEQMGYQLDCEIDRLCCLHEREGLSGRLLFERIEDCVNIEHVLKESSASWDGGYCICGMTGSGESFALRDPWGIRPAFYYADEELVVVASERPVIQTALRLDTHAIKELNPGEAIWVNKKGKVRLSQVNMPQAVAPCSFERIYFSRGNDADIYQERKKLGILLADRIARACNYDFAHTVFSFIPNTAEVAYIGMIERLREISPHGLRAEKVVSKDIKLRTFITEGSSRNDLAAHVYDVTYGIVKERQDTLVVIDDSIVRGTTLKQSIIQILGTLRPRKIIIVSSSPQVRYPDYYGIDMSRMGEFVAFRAAIELLKEHGGTKLIDDVYHKCRAQQHLPKEEIVNYVKAIYEPFTDKEISKKIAELVTPEDADFSVEIIYQNLEGLHQACPKHTGDWYFTGNYPTPGGNRLINQSFLNWYEGRDKTSID